MRAVRRWVYWRLDAVVEFLDRGVYRLRALADRVDPGFQPTRLSAEDYLRAYGDLGYGTDVRMADFFLQTSAHDHDEQSDDPKHHWDCLKRGIHAVGVPAAACPNHNLVICVTCHVT